MHIEVVKSISSFIRTPIELCSASYVLRYGANQNLHCKCGIFNGIFKLFLLGGSVRILSWCPDFPCELKLM